VGSYWACSVMKSKLRVWTPPELLSRGRLNLRRIVRLTMGTTRGVQVRFRFTSDDGFLRRTGACVAIIAVLFVASVALLHHDDPSSSSVCSICNLLNLPLLGPRIPVQLPQPVEYWDKAPLQVQTSTLDRAAYRTSPRAPPSA
jgi:hypothetical protein